MENNSIINTLLGDWYILFSNFPMWLKGDRKHPMFHYEKSSVPNRMKDTVSFEKHGQRKTIRGVDTRVGKHEFIWRGSGLLFLFRSRWKLSYMSPDQQWAIIAFDKSLVSPAGHDIIARTPVAEDVVMAEMLASFSRLYPGVALEKVAQLAPRAATARHHASAASQKAFCTRG
jgi:hypothetical protein